MTKTEERSTMSRLNNVPDEMMLNILQFNTIVEIENTREFQSEFVKKCTTFVDMKDAIRTNNLSNMKWIKDRYNGRPLWQGNMDFCTFYSFFNLPFSNVL